MAKLAVIVLGNRRSGKSTTWNALFGRVVRTGSETRRLVLNGEPISVFLVSGSPEERKEYVGDIIGRTQPYIILCSLQYSPHVTESIDYFVQNGYSLYVQWLNPGYSDEAILADRLGLMTILLYGGATVTIRDATGDPTRRVRENQSSAAGVGR